MKYLQVLHSEAEDGQIANTLEPAADEAPPDDASVGGRLSTIEEGTEETEASSISNLLADFDDQPPPRM